MDIVTTRKLNILIQLAEADKHFAKVERDMIYQIARSRNFPEELVTDLIHHPQPIDSLGALSQEQKLDFLISSIELIFIDQKVFESEIVFTRSIAIKLGFSKNVVDYLVANFERITLDELKRIVLTQYVVG